MKTLQTLIARVVRRLDTKGDMPITAADLAGILESEMAEIEMNQESTECNVARETVQEREHVEGCPKNYDYRNDCACPITETGCDRKFYEGTGEAVTGEGNAPRATIRSESGKFHIYTPFGDYHCTCVTREDAERVLSERFPINVIKVMPRVSR